MWKAHAASLGLPWFLCACWVNEDTAAPVCVANFSVSCAGTPEKSLCMMMASPSFIGLKENGIFTHWQTKKRSFGNLAACGFLSYAASAPAVLLSSSDIPKMEYHSICRVPTMFRFPMPCQTFCVPLSPYHSAYVSCDLWKYLSFSPLLLICFDQVKRCLGSVWDDWLSGRRNRAALRWAATAVCHNTDFLIPSMSQNLQKPKPCRYLLSVKFSDQHIQELCGWQTTEMHAHTNSECAHYEWCKCRIYRQ